MQHILNGASVCITEEDRIGVIGRNGAGKTTLLRILTGQEEPDEGRIIRSSGLRIGTLSQDEPYTAEDTVIGFLMHASHREEWDCARMAARFQVKGDMLRSRIRALSGGYRMRVKLAAMLLDEPHIILLDEPTNYLDLSTLILLERFLLSFNGGYFIISHDRQFLRTTCDKTLSVEDGDAVFFPGAVEDYLAFRDEVREQMIEANKAVEERREKLTSFIERFRANASTASRARSKMRELSKLLPIEIPAAAKNVRMRIPGGDERRGTALSSDALAIGYGKHAVARNIRLEIARGSHVAVLGDNGEGKTTLIRTLAGELPSLGGTVSFGIETKVAYYAQHVYASLPAGKTVQSYLESCAGKDILAQDIRDLAGSFLFRGDAVEKNISVLSGGERSRLALAGLLLSGANILFLDEPTNHLDFETVETLAQALKNFTGTILFVSHDRTFVNLIATDILEVKRGSVTHYPGSYDDYVWRLTRDASDDDSDPSGNEKRASSAVPEKKKNIAAERRRAIQAVAAAERDLKAYQNERAEVMTFFESGAFDASKSARLAELDSLIRDAEGSWLRLCEELETIDGRAIPPSP